MSRMYEALTNAQQRGVATEVPTFAIHNLADRLAGIEADVTPDAGADLPPRASPRKASAPEPGNGVELRCLPIQASNQAAVIPWNIAGSPGGAQYRIIRTRIIQHWAQPKIMVVSGACSGDGKTVSAINIAGMLSLREGTNTLLIDGDLRRAGLTSTLGLPAGPGLKEALSRSCTLQEAIVRVEQYPDLYVMTAGTAHTGAEELLDSEHWKSLCATVREHFSFVIIDAPPVASVADYELLQAACDGVILVVRPGHTDRTLFRKTLDLVPEAKRLGVILNDNPEWFLWKTHESYYENY
jgi:capsular exopolysaccharide synthesis family protein